MSIFDKFKKKDDQSPAQPVLKSKSASKKQATPLAEAPASAPVEKVGPVGESQGVFIRPLITEKAAVLNQFNQYVFEDSNAWKSVKDIVVDYKQEYMYVLDGSTIWKVRL